MEERAQFACTTKSHVFFFSRWWNLHISTVHTHTQSSSSLAIQCKIYTKRNKQTATLFIVFALSSRMRWYQPLNLVKFVVHVPLKPKKNTNANSKHRFQVENCMWCGSIRWLQPLTNVTHQLHNSSYTSSRKQQLQHRRLYSTGTSNKFIGRIKFYVQVQQKKLKTTRVFRLIAVERSFTVNFRYWPGCIRCIHQCSVFSIHYILRHSGVGVVVVVIVILAIRMRFYEILRGMKCEESNKAW